MRFILALLALSSSSSCIKLPDQTVNYGVEVSNQEILNAINQAPSPPKQSIKAGEFRYTESYLELENYRNQNGMVQIGTTVTCREEHSDHYKIILRTEKTELVDGQRKVFQDETSAEIPKIDQSLLNTQAQSTSVKYFNLKKDWITWEIPESIKNRENCGGLSQDLCAKGVPALKLSYDRVQWTDGQAEKISYRHIISSFVPYLSYELSTCASTRIPYENTRISVMQCNDVKDFSSGTLPDHLPPNTCK